MATSTELYILIYDSLLNSLGQGIFWGLILGLIVYIISIAK